MATQRTRELMACEPDLRQLQAAIRSRRRLREEAIKLNRVVRAGQERLREIDEEEEVLSTMIDAAGEAVETAVTKPMEPSEAEVSGSHR